MSDDAYTGEVREDDGDAEPEDGAQREADGELVGLAELAHGQQGRRQHHQPGGVELTAPVLAR